MRRQFDAKSSAEALERILQWSVRKSVSHVGCHGDFGTTMLGERPIAVGGVALSKTSMRCATGFASVLLIRQTRFEFRSDETIRGRGE